MAREIVKRNLNAILSAEKRGAMEKYLKTFWNKGNRAFFFALLGGFFMLVRGFSIVPVALADPGPYLEAREVKLGKAGAITTSSVLTPVSGGRIKFSFRNPNTGNIAVFASLSSVTGAGAEPKTGTWDIELHDATRGITIADSRDVKRFLSGITDQGMIGVASIFTDLKQDVTYEIRLRHATSAGTLRTKNVDVVVLPLFSGKTISLNHAQITNTTGITATATTYVDTDLVGSISLDPSITGAYVLITAALNTKSTGVGRVRAGSWRLQAGQQGKYKEYGVPIERYLSGSKDIGSVVLHALAGPFNASAGKISFKVQHKSSGRGIQTFNGTLMAIALSDYDPEKGIQYDYVSGQTNSAGIIKTTSSSLTPVYDTRTGDRVRVSPVLSYETKVFLGAHFNNGSPVSATVTYDIAAGDTSQAQAVMRVTYTNDKGAGCLFSVSNVLTAGRHDLDLRHATTSMVHTSGANLVYVILGSNSHPARSTNPSASKAWKDVRGGDADRGLKSL
jgi:hypothetical protein